MLKVSVNKFEELTKGEVKVLEWLKKIYKDISHEVHIYSQCNIAGNKRPDFIVVDAHRGIAILEVKDWTQEYILNVDKRNVELNDRTGENPVKQVKGYKTILNAGILSREFDDISDDDIVMSVIFVNMNSDSREIDRLGLLFDKGINYMFKDNFKNSTEEIFFKDGVVDYTSENLKEIRVTLFPEMEIMTYSNDENIKDSSSLKVLDFEQEEYARGLPMGHYMVTGIPGSGKTVILMARAIHLIRENPDWKILILTYNKSLRYKLQSRLDKISSRFSKDINNRDVNLENIEIRHFHGETPLHLNGARKPADMEWNDWFNEGQAQICLQNAKPQYDAVLIDEYQDFRMSWIELCVKLCKDYYVEKTGKNVKNIFLAGDRLQSIYNSKDISWKSIGLNMQGRSKFLKISYRSANEHMNLALSFLQNDKELKKEVDKFYKEEDEQDCVLETLESLNKGSLELVEANYGYIGEKIQELKRIGYKNEDFLILANSKPSCDEVIRQMPSDLKYQMAFVKSLEPSEIGNNIILTTYHSSKGLEAKVVFLTNIDYIMGDTDQIKRKIVYVGITRASEKLYMLKAPNRRGVFINELEDLVN